MLSISPPCPSPAAATSDFRPSRRSAVGLGCSCVGCPCGWCGGRFATTTRWRWWHPRHHRGLWLGPWPWPYSGGCWIFEALNIWVDSKNGDVLFGKNRWDPSKMGEGWLTASTQLGRFFWLFFCHFYLPLDGSKMFKNKPIDEGHLDFFWDTSSPWVDLPRVQGSPSIEAAFAKACTFSSTWPWCSSAPSSSQAENGNTTCGFRDF